MTAFVAVLLGALSLLVYDAYRKRREILTLRDSLAKVQVEKVKVENVLNSSMDPAVAKLRIEDRLHNEKRTLSVLFSDLVDFTSLSETAAPETIISELNQIFGILAPALTRFNGHIDKFIGDGMMAEFGVPHAAHHHPLNAVLSALSMQKRLRVYGSRWKMRIGVASGVSLVGLMGSHARKDYTAIGNTVNLAARLQALCPVSSVCVDETIYQAAHRWIDFRRIRSGLKPEAIRTLEEKLAKLTQEIDAYPSASDCLEAANLCVDLGDMPRALRFHKRVLDLDPKQRGPVERSLATLISNEERAYLDIKGKKDRVAVYEALGLKNFLGTDRVPPRVRHTYDWLTSELPLLEEWNNSIEAIEGRLGHAKVTAAVSAAIADMMGLGEERVKEAFLAGYYGDVGKAHVPEYLLCYEGQLKDLSDADQEKIRSHVTESEKVLAQTNVPTTPGMLRAIRQHHERFDGKGYPAGLKGDEIDILAKIVRIADSYEAITAWRSYQDALTRDSALVEICRDISEGAVDPEVGKIFLALMSGQTD